MSELKPCPFCGGEAEMLTAESMHGGNIYGVMCANCAGRSDIYDTEAEAIAAWNTRAGRRTCHIVKGSRKYVLSDGTELFEDGCSECNGYLGEEDNFCPNCGARAVGE